MFPSSGDTVFCRGHPVCPSRPLSISSPELYAEGCPLCGLCEYFCFIKLATVGGLVGLVSSQFDWLPGSALYKGSLAGLGHTAAG